MRATPKIDIQPALLWLLIIIKVSHGWILPSQSVNYRKSFWLASSTSLTTTVEPLGGVTEFDAWFAALGEKATCQSSIRHTAFGRLRGLECRDGSLINQIVLTVPKTVVLSSNYSEADWDAQLATKLWKECLKGQNSGMYGYCSLLTFGRPVDTSTVPPSTAPDTLRHWTEEQMELLKQSIKGNQLVDLNRQQQRDWRAKYNALDDGTDMTWEQFQWCMEVVHSRAFQGNYGGSPGRTIGSTISPLVAALLGWTYFQNTVYTSDVMLIGLGVLGFAPVLANVLLPEPPQAVLLPLIDSANHLQEADSSIQYDPLSSKFSLSVGSKCLATEDNGLQQLYISYGVKSDSELLLNYGFLLGVSCSSEGEDEKMALRKKLAQSFVARNP